MGMNADEADRAVAMMMALAVRNAMEGFHAKHLSDEQMRELNPLIRNAIFTVLYAMREGVGPRPHPRAKRYLSFLQANVPPYWEPPELLPEYAA